MTSLAERVANQFLALQVVERFAATRPLKPEKLKEALLKLRKGARPSFKFEELRRILDGIGGWKIEPSIALGIGGASYRRWGEVQHYTSENLQAVEAEHKKALSEQVTTLPQVGAVKARAYRKQVSDIHTIGDRPGFTFQIWEGVDGYLIESPSSARFETPTKELSRTSIDEDYCSLLLGRAAPGSVDDYSKFWDWMVGPSQFIKQVNEFLGTESIEVERERKKQKLRTLENTGTCPVCFGNFKLTPKALEGKESHFPGMTLHGYKRPGLGYNDGECFGRNWPPFELSCEGTKAWRIELIHKAEDKEDYIKSLHHPNLTYFQDAEYPYDLQTKDRLAPAVWARKLANTIEHQKFVLKMMKEDIQKLDKAISTWKPQALFQPA